LVSKKLSGDATDEDIKELQFYLSANPQLAAQYQLLQQFWELHDTPNQLFVEESLQKVLNRLNLPVAEPLEKDDLPKRTVIYFMRKYAAIAAAVLIILSAGIFSLSTHRKKEPAASLAGFEIKQNSKGVKSTIELADGSKVWLNADSKIEYPKSFAGNTREIFLNGEAFFEVAKNPSKPFIIHLANGTVRVIGTSFNIRAYDNEKVVETSVATGKVAFIPKYKVSDKPQDTFFLTPNNKVRYIFNAQKIIITPTLSKDDKAWTEGKLIFKAMNLQDIAVQLERNFGKKVIFVDEDAKEFILTGSFQNDTLEDIMFYLSKTKTFYYKITIKELLIATEPGKL